MMVSRKLPRLLVLLLLGTALPACESVVGPKGDPRADGEWPSASPADVGLDPGIMEDLRRQLRNGAYPALHSLLVVRHGSLVFEEYFRGYSTDRPHSMQSVSKSIASLLVGIALQQGFIESVDQPVLSFFPEYEDLQNVDARKRQLTIEHLLTMRTGYAWYESPYPGSPLEQLNTDTSDWVRFMLEWPMQEPPGGRFNYNTGGVVLLAALVGNAAQQRADLFARDYLFEPLGVGEHWWIHGPPDQLPHMGGGLYMRPRDMAKIGQLVLDGGVWNGRQVVDPEWLRESLRRRVPGAWSFGNHPVDYGYLWWITDLDDPMGNQTRPGDIYIAAGARGQWIFIVPEYDLVVVATGWEYGDEWVAPLDLLYTSILEAVM